MLAIFLVGGSAIKLVDYLFTTPSSRDEAWLQSLAERHSPQYEPHQLEQIQVADDLLSRISAQFFEDCPWYISGNEIELTPDSQEADGIDFVGSWDSIRLSFDSRETRILKFENRSMARGDAPDAVPESAALEAKAKRFLEEISGAVIPSDYHYMGVESSSRSLLLTYHRIGNVKEPFRVLGWRRHDPATGLPFYHDVHSVEWHPEFGFVWASIGRPSPVIPAGGATVSEERAISIAIRHANYPEEVRWKWWEKPKCPRTTFLAKDAQALLCFLDPSRLILLPEKRKHSDPGKVRLCWIISCLYPVNPSGMRSSAVLEFIIDASSGDVYGWSI